MAATSSDIKRWRLDAEDQSDDLEEQIEWLKQQRIIYSDKVKAGDWEITADSTEGSSTQGKRGVSDRDNHDAIVGAIDQIKRELGTGGKSRGSLLGFRINHITG